MDIQTIVSNLTNAIQTGDPRIKSRYGFKDKNTGDAIYLRYIEWNVIAAVLDEHAPGWSFSNMQTTIGNDTVFISGDLTIAGTTRTGFGAAPTLDQYGKFNEPGIKGAASDALKRAAVLFGLGRFLYDEKENERRPAQGTGFDAAVGNTRSNAMAAGAAYGAEQRTFVLKDPDSPITDRQLGALQKINGSEACADLKFSKSLDKLTKGEASSLMDDLKGNR